MRLEKGEETAKQVFAKFHGSYDFRKICTESGLQLMIKIPTTLLVIKDTLVIMYLEPIKSTST